MSLKPWHQAYSFHAGCMQHPVFPFVALCLRAVLHAIKCCTDGMTAPSSPFFVIVFHTLNSLPMRLLQPVPATAATYAGHRCYMCWPPLQPVLATAATCAGHPCNLCWLLQGCALVHLHRQPDQGRCSTGYSYPDSPGAEAHAASQHEWIWHQS